MGQQRKANRQTQRKRGGGAACGDRWTCDALKSEAKNQGKNFRKIFTECMSCLKPSAILGGRQTRRNRKRRQTRRK